MYTLICFILLLHPNITIHSVTLENNHLTLDVCEAILDYTGSSQEYELVNTLTALAAKIPGASYFTLNINGSLGFLVKGTEINRQPLYVPPRPPSPAPLLPHP